MNGPKWTPERRDAFKRVIESARRFVRTADEFAEDYPEACGEDLQALEEAMAAEGRAWDDAPMKNVMSASDRTGEEIDAVTDVTAAEAQSILDVCEAAETYLAKSGFAPLTSSGEPTILDRLPDLARTVVALHAQVADLTAQRDRLAQANADLGKRAVELQVERDALRVILDGRTAMPTLAEIAAHSEAHGGRWLVQGGTVEMHAAPRSTARLSVWPDAADAPYEDEGAETWLAECAGVRVLPIDQDDRPCAWPTVPAEGNAS